MSKLRSAVYGFIVGDCLGVPFEFKRRGSFNCSGMTGHGTHNQPAGTWSDDTSMMLATLDSLGKGNYKTDTKDMGSRFKKWIYEGKYTSDGKVFDYGITTKQALDLGAGLDDYYSNGNGSLMRVLPLAFIECIDSDIDKVSAITHAHPISKEACRIYVTIAKALIKGGSLKSILNGIATSETFERLKYIDTLKEQYIKSSGFVVDTLEASLWSLITTDSYKDAVLKAVNLGDDTDTIGAVTGGLAGIIYGYEAIPKEWIISLRGKKLIDSYCSWQFYKNS